MPSRSARSQAPWGSCCWGFCSASSSAISIFYTCQSSGGGYHASTHLRCFLTMCAGLLAGLGFSLLPCPLLALAVLAVPLTLHPNKQYLLENKKALILRSALSCLYAKAHYRPAS